MGHLSMIPGPDGQPDRPQIPQQRTPAHQPFCTNHIPGADASDFGTCMAEDLAVSDAYVGISSDPSIGGGVRFDIGGCQGATVDEAEQFVLALMVQIARARGAAIPSSALASVTS